MKVLTALYLDKRRRKDNGTYPLKLRVSFQQERRYYSTRIDVRPEDWIKVNSTSSNSRIKKLRTNVYAVQNTADETIRRLEDFSFTKFEALYFQTKHNNTTVDHAFERYIMMLQTEGRASTAESYGNAKSSLSKFRNGIQFVDITPTLLSQYEHWMLNQGRTLSTIGIYLRSLRTLINMAIEEGIIKREQYPFGKRRYQIPMGQNIKKSLTKEEIAAIYHHELPALSSGDRARDFWIFSFLANGMNFKDICRLKFSNMVNDTLVFYRAKTSRTRRSRPIPIVAVITEDMQRIMQKWGCKERMPDNFIFPILSTNITAKNERELVKQFIRTTNNWLRRLAVDVGITKKVTTYSARHSFSTLMRDQGASIEFIKESLGHHSTQTTEAYLNAFPDSMKRQLSRQLCSLFKSVEKI